ncbi:VanZ family protein [Streptomyces sp. NPDC086549]|uniref:VanZ family protein n=1 Tax=Streptomyces sp. NPDC086549 TaxID=3365752 RepID=UPI0037F4BA7A
MSPAASGLVVVLRARQGRPGWTGSHAVTRLLTAGYTAAVLALTVFPIVVTTGKYADMQPWTSQVNYVPMLSPDPSIAANVLLTVPLGMLLPLMSAKAGSLARVTVVAAAVSLSIELTQLLMFIMCHNARSADVTDLIVNTLGGMVGYLALRLASRVRATARLLDALALPGSATATRQHEVRAGALHPVDTTVARS